MSVLDEAQRLAARGRMTEAVALVGQAADAGDPEAMFALANWRIFAIHGRPDLAEAHRLLDGAAAAGHLEARLLKANLLASGTGAPADEAAANALLREAASESPDAREQLELLDAMEGRPPVSPATGEVLSPEPHVRAVRGLLAEAECAYLMRRSERHLRPSFINDPLSGRPIPHPTRTSFGMNFGPTLEDLAVRAINRRLAAVTGTDVACGEPLQILRYAPGQEYRPHMDALPGVTNQRCWTVLVYLNAEFEGGATVFEQLDLTFRGAPGDALIFTSLDASGRPDLRTRHAGLPVTSGAKWLATRWIRQAPVDPFRL